MNICQISQVKCYDHSLLDYMSFESPKRAYYLNTMRYHGASIKNIYCRHFSSTMTQFIRIYDHFKVSLIGQRFLLILAHGQYPLKVESPCNIVVRWSWQMIVLHHDLPLVLSNLHRIYKCTYYGKTILMTKSSHPSN